MGFFDNITRPFVSLEKKSVKGMKTVVRAVKHHPIESAIGAAALLGGAALIVGTGGLATPFVVEGEAALLGAELAAVGTEVAVEAAVEIGVEAAVETGIEAAVETGVEAAVETGVETGVEEIGVEAEEEFFDVEEFLDEEFVADDGTVMVQRTVPLDDIGFDYASLPDGVQSEISPSVFDSIKTSIMENTQGLRAGISSAEEWAQGVSRIISQHPITGVFNAISQSALVKGFITTLTAIGVVTTIKDVVTEIATDDKKKDNNSSKLDKLGNKIDKLKGILKGDKETISKLTVDLLTDDEDIKKLSEQIISEGHTITDLSRQIIDEENKEQLLQQKNTELEGELNEEQNEINRIKNEIDDIKELVGESFLRPLDFQEMLLLMNELEPNDVVSFLARNRGDYEKLSDKQKKQIIVLGKNKMNL